MVDVEPYGLSDAGGDPLDDDSSSCDREPSDPDDPWDKSSKKKRKKTPKKVLRERPGKEAKAIATSKIVVNLLDFTGKDLNESADSFAWFL